MLESLHRPIPVSRLMPGFDCHAHVFTLNGPFPQDARYIPVRPATRDAWLAKLRASGLDGGVLVQPSFLGTDNRELLDALAVLGDRFRGIAVLAPTTSEGDLRRLAAGGVVGVRWNLVGLDALPDPREEPWRSHLLRLAAIGWHLELHLEGRRLAAMLAALAESPVRVVVDHFGVPEAPLGAPGDSCPALLEAVRRGRTWVKLSAPYRSPLADLRHHAEALLAAGGPERLVWGSDWPWTRHEGRHDYPECLGWLADWLPYREVRAAVLSASPRALYGLPA